MAIRVVCKELRAQGQIAERACGLIIGCFTLLFKIIKKLIFAKCLKIKPNPDHSLIIDAKKKHTGCPYKMLQNPNRPLSLLLLYTNIMILILANVPRDRNTGHRLKDVF